MTTGFASSRRAQSLLAICLISAGVCGAQPVQAGPSLETTENTAIGAQATFNNNWAQTFEAKGAMEVVNSAGAAVPLGLQPFEVLTVTTELLPNSGLAELTAVVSMMSVDGGTLQAFSSINPERLVGGKTDPNSSTTPNTSTNLVFNTNENNGLPALRITPGTGESSVIGASIIGTNIGTDSLQVTGSLGTSVLNNLTAF
jgi:hypothetical protein